MEITFPVYIGLLIIWSSNTNYSVIMLIIIIITYAFITLKANMEIVMFL